MNSNTLQSTQNIKNHAPNFAFEPFHFSLEQTVDVKPFGRIKLRPIRITDESRMIQFHKKLSEESVHLRYFEQIALGTRILHERLAKVCANTADSIAIVAEREVAGKQPTQILGVGRLCTHEETETASFALLIADEAQTTTLPGELLKRLVVIAKAFHFRNLISEFLVADYDGLRLCRALGFNLHTIPEDGIVDVCRHL